MMLDQQYTMLIFNQIVCIADYNQDSMTYAKFAQYRNSAKGFAHFRNETARISRSWRYIVRQMIHYIAESRMAGEKHIIRTSSHPIWASLLYFPGLLFYYYLMHTGRKY